MKAIHTLLLAVFSLLAPALHAGTFTTAAWTNDASSGIVSGQTSWAYHFGSATNTTVNGVPVPGSATGAPLVVDGRFTLNGANLVFNGDTNNVTTGGSDIIANDFVYGGFPATITLLGLTAGQNYTASFLSVGWQPDGGDPAFRALTFASGGDSQSVQQSQFGNDNGIRIDYAFTADAATRVITVAVNNPNNATFHLYGLALRQTTGSSLVVSNTFDSGTGSLRQALVNAAAAPGADIITFDAALSGTTITLSSEIVINDTTGTAFIDSALPAGVTIDGGPGSHRLFSVNAVSSLAIRGVTLTGGGGTGATASGQGGAIYSAGSLVLDRCTLHSNTAVEGGAVRSVGSAIAATQSTFSGNTALIGGACSLADGGPSATFTHCTLAGNTATGTFVGGPGNVGGGGLFLFNKAITLTGTLIAGNTSPHGPDVQQFNMLPVTSGVNFIGDLTGSGLTASATLLTTAQNGSINLGPLASNGGPTQTRALLAGSPAIDAAVGSTIIADQRGFAISGTPDIGAFEAVILSTLVINTADSGAGSLRQALADAAAIAGADTITFGAPLVAGSVVGLTADLSIADAAGVTVNTAISGGAVDVAVNVGTLSFGAGSVWSGGGRIFLGATSGSAAATVDLADADGGLTLPAPITVRAGSTGVKTLRATNTDGMNTYAGAITLAADATVEQLGSHFNAFNSPEGMDFTGDVNVGAALLTVTGDSNAGVFFTGRVFRVGTGAEQARMKVADFSAVSLTLRGTGDNTRLTLDAESSFNGGLFLRKTSSASVHALGGGLPAGTTALNSFKPGQSDGGDQIADTCSVTLNSSASAHYQLVGDETIDALNGSHTISASGTLTLGAAGGSGSSNYQSYAGTYDIAKIGAGTQTFSGSFTSGSINLPNTGTLSVSGGVLNLTGNFATSSGATAQSGGTLAGTGTAPRITLESGGFLAPGDATVPAGNPLADKIGILTVATQTVLPNSPGNLTWNGGGTARFHLSGTGATSDRVAIAAQLIKGTAGSYTFDFQGTGLVGQTYTLATFASSNFTAADFSYTGLAPGLTGTFTLNPTSLTFTTTAFTGIVANNANSGPGSLRQTLADAAATTGPDTITFAPGFTGPITLTSGEFTINHDVTIDATSLPAGLTISGNNASRIFFVDGFGHLTLRGLTLTGGNGVGAVDSSFGGAIYNKGSTLTLTHCTLSGNFASGNGGAITSFSPLMLTHCTLSGNSSDFGGAITSFSSTLTLTHCTLSGNNATSDGGAIDNGGGTLTLTNSIVAGNTASSGGPDIFHSGGTITASGVNFIGDTANSGLTASATILTGNAQLSALASNGGPTQTMALLPGSPALDAASVIGGLTTDQRGFSRSRDGNAVAGALPDIGAYEAQVAPVASIGWNFVGGGPAGSSGTLASGDVAGVFPQANWNNLTTDADGTATGTYANGPASIKDSTGASLSPNLRLWWDAPGTWGQPAAGLTTPDRKLMGGYLDSFGAANTGTNLYSTTDNQPFFAVADLPAAATLGGYKVVVYADTDNTDNRVGEYWLTTNNGNPADITGTTDLSPHLFLKDSGNFTGTYTRVPASSTSFAGAVAGNFFVLENQTQPAFILRTEDNPGSRAVLNAVQLVRNEIIVVTTAADENDPNGTLGAGISLREALRDAPDGAGILFDSTLNGATLTLGGEIVIGKSVTIDASNLSGGLTIDGGGTNRILHSSGSSLTLRGLTFTGGNGVGQFSSGYGGAVFKGGGTLALTGCTFTGNAIAITGTNSSTGGGAVVTDGGTALLTHCTFSGNSATATGTGSLSEGGAIYHAGGPQQRTLTLTHCTLANNTATASTAVGGGIFNNGPLTLSNSIVAGNTATTSGADISNIGTLTRAGASLVQSLAGGGTVTGTGTISTADPQLAPLDNYGGPTKTRALLPGSPARNAAVGSTITSDQRGFPIVGIRDIGAYEAGTLLDFDAWAYETLPGTATAPQHAPTFDFDGDGRTLLLEYAALGSGTVPEAGSPLALTRNPAGTLATIVMPCRFDAPDLFYTIERSTNLTAAWTTIATFNSATNGYIIFAAGTAYADNDDFSITFTDTFITGQPTVFYRLRVTQQ